MKTAQHLTRLIALSANLGLLLGIYLEGNADTIEPTALTATLAVSALAIALPTTTRKN